MDDTEFENILVVGVVSRDTPDENPPTSCIVDRSRNCISIIQQPVLVFPRDSEEFAVAHSPLEKRTCEAVTDLKQVVGGRILVVDLVLFPQVILILEQRK